MSSDYNTEQFVASSTNNNLLTSEDIAMVARKVTGDPLVKVLEYDLGSYSANKLGFLASHQLLNIQVQRKNASRTEEMKLFVKAIPCDNEKQAEFLNSEGIFTKESYFFDTVAPKLLENCIGEKWSPTCYLAKENVLVMEDLRADGYKLLDNLFDEPVAIKATLASLARFHACSILAESKLNKDSTIPKTLGECYAVCCKESTFIYVGKVRDWFTASVNIVANVADRLGYNVQKLRKTFDRLYDVIKPSKVHRNVLCHGDLWKNNLMFDSSKPPYKCVLVDFQIVRYGPLALDILQFLYINTSAEFRRKFEKSYVEYYHSILEETVAQSDATKIAKVPTVDEIIAGLDDLRLFGAGIACLYYPTVLIDPDMLEKYTKTSEGYDKFLFGDRTEIIISYMEEDDLFKSKFEEVITEMAKISEQIYC